MTANIQTITLDLTNSAYSAAQKVFVVQGDSGTRPVKAVITDNGMVRTDLSHESVCLYIDNNGDRPTYVEGISVVNGVAEFNIPQSAVLNAGTMKAELRFVDEENRVLTSVSFVVEVGASVYDENALLGTDDGDVLIRMVEQTRKSAAAAAESAAEAEKTADNLVGRVDAAIEELTDAKERGEFDGVSVTHEWNGTELTVTSASGTSSSDLKGDKGDDGSDGKDGVNGKDGISATHSWNGTVLTITSASGTSSADLKGEKGDKGATGSTGPRGEKGEKGDKGDKGEDGADYILTDDDKREIATKVNAVSYSVTQNLTDEQKQTARANIDAVSQAELADGLAQKVDASLVVSNILSDTDSGLIVLRNNIPNGSAVSAFVREHGVSSSQTQSLTLTQKTRARNNIDVDGGKWELLYTIEGDGETKTWEYTQFANGSPLKLTAVSAVVIQDVAEAENSYGFLYAYSGEKTTPLPMAIYNYFTKNTAPTTPGTQRAYGVVEQYKGQYRAYSVGMAKKGNEIMRYTPYTQAKHTTADYPYIDRIKVEKQTGVFSAGNKIEVYGVRCYG